MGRKGEEKRMGGRERMKRGIEEWKEEEKMGRKIERGM